MRVVLCQEYIYIYNIYIYISLRECGVLSCVLAYGTIGIRYNRYTVQEVYGIVGMQYNRYTV